jgi:asparagine synthase (glutamine-hydrolysing)
MCGITGLWAVNGKSAGDLTSLAAAMADTMHHRGPDDGGVAIDDAAGVAVGFRRLAIIDLSPAGHQPMTSASGRFTIVFNGEVYNFESIRKELIDAGAAPSWRGHSDTEVLLAAFEAWGVTAAVQRFIGMFAIALWDSRARKLHLIRDRMGVKPLYYAFTREAFVFGSELKAILASQCVDERVNRDAVSLYTRYSYVPAPYTIYEGVFKLTAGTILTVENPGRVTAPVAYWSVRDAVQRGIANPFTGSDEEAVELVNVVASDAVGLRMISDVPLGVFLSGGIDSSLVAALMQSQSSRKVKTFSIGFQESDYDESRYAAAVARHLGTDHMELYATPQDALDVIPSLPEIYDEPFADSSQIPTHLVAKLARKHVTVALSGDGGDELFGGYNRYFMSQKLWRYAGRIPSSLRSVAARSLRSVPISAWNTLFDPTRRYAPRILRRDRAGERIHKLARAMSRNDVEVLYFELTTSWRDIVPNARELPIAVTQRDEWPHVADPIERMMFLDQVSYLPDDILVKVDRATMAVSLEAREPLLDHRLVELAWRLPLRMKLRDGKGKWALRQLLYRHVPERLIERPKMGFALPIDRWLRGPLRDWAESLLDRRRLEQEGFFKADVVAATWRQHTSEKHNWQHYLWTVLMFQAWLDAQRRRSVVHADAPRLSATR